MGKHPVAMTNERDQLISINGLKMCAHFLEGESRLEKSRRLSQKLIEREELKGLGDFLRARNLRIAYTSGAFDIIHKGHARYLNLAKSLGDVLVVGLNSDSSIRDLKGPNRPILTQEDRAEMLSFLDSVTYITIYEEPTGQEVIKLLRPNSYLCVEGSWEGDLATKKEVIAMADCGGEVFYTPRQNPQSSTSKIIETIERQYGENIIEGIRQRMTQEEKRGK